MNLRKFFLNQNDGMLIEPFSIMHFILILITLIIMLLIYKKRDKINLKTSRIILAVVLVINIILRRGSFIYYGVYDYHSHLDINFCNFTAILMLIYSLTGNKKLYKYCYYMVFIGPLLSILFPCLTFSLKNYSFYSFLILHYILFIFNFIFYLKEDISFSKGNLIKVIKFILRYFVIVYIIDYLFKFDYNKIDTFINMDIFIINYLRNYGLIISYLIMIIVIMLLLLLASFILMKKDKK